MNNTADLKQRDNWTKQHFSGAKAILLFSFIYDGRPSADLLPMWQTKSESKKLDKIRTRRTLTWTDPKTGLQVRCEAVQYAGYPTIEWTLYFKNTGTADTPILSDIQALDAVLAQTESNLHSFNGDSCTKDSFKPFETPMNAGVEKRFAPGGGRSSNGAWPYYNLASKSDGVILAIGWPGQWACTFSGTQEGVKIRAGQELTHFTLHPGEEVRSPLIALMFYKGNWISGQNLWRKWMLDQNFPKDHGKKVAPKVAGFCGNWFANYITNQQGELEFLNLYIKEKIGLDSWWMDAGWYPNDGGWWSVGTWEADRKRFPDELKSISALIHQNKMQYILWFEPERVAEGTWLANNHPEWIWGGKKGALVDFGNPDALRWITDRVDKIITEQGVDIYRQDFNMDPLAYWRQNDTENRQGITENKHVVGYLACWDELQRRHPGMLIDSCASGGRRDDLESMRRALPFLRSDYCTDPEGMQCHTYGFNLWLPYYRGATDNLVDYDWWSNLSPLMMPAWNMRDEAMDFAKARKLVEQWRLVVPYLFGDFYPLTTYSEKSDCWMAFQFNRPNQGDGMVQAFRRKDNADASCVLKLRDLDPKAIYTVRMIETSLPQSFTGETLMKEGMRIETNKHPGWFVLFYAKSK